MKFADLHLHTNFSDGTFTPHELVEEAKRAQLSCIGLTDHDSVSGVEPVIKEAGSDLEVIPGVELTAEVNTNEIHILGYFIDVRSEALERELVKIRKRRISRVHEMIDKLKEHGIQLDAQEVFAIAGEGSVSRLHIARVMLTRGIISNIPEAFSRFIGNKGCAYVGRFSLTAEDAIKIIIDAGGISVLAHPHSLRCDELIPSFVKAGLRGLEAYYPEHSQAVRRYYEEVAQKYGLLVTGGSDCHGMAKPGISVGCIRIPYDIVEALKKEKYG